LKKQQAACELKFQRRFVFDSAIRNFGEADV